MDRESYWQGVFKGYSENYDFENMDLYTGDLPLTAKAVMHLSESGYVLSRKAEMWSANSNEFVFFFDTDRLTDELCEKCIRHACDEGIDMIDLEGTRNHMCTSVVAVFVCNESDDAAISRVKSSRVYRNFKMGLKGWMELQVVLVDLGRDAVYSNRFGRDSAKFLNEVLHPRKRRRASGLGIIRKMFE